MILPCIEHSSSLEHVNFFLHIRPEKRLLDGCHLSLHREAPNPTRRRAGRGMSELYWRTIRRILTAQVLNLVFAELILLTSMLVEREIGAGEGGKEKKTENTQSPGTGGYADRLK